MATQKRKIAVETNEEGDGVATGTVIGTLAGIVVATTLDSVDVSIVRTINGVDQTLLALDGVTEGGFYNPQDAIHDPQTGAAIEGLRAPFVLEGENITVTASNAGEEPGTVQVVFITYT